MSLSKAIKCRHSFLTSHAQTLAAVTFLILIVAFGGVVGTGSPTNPPPEDQSSSEAPPDEPTQPAHSDLDPDSTDKLTPDLSETRT